jgi:hypothetical protein
MTWKHIIVVCSISAGAMAAERFDQMVRNDFFAGFAGDAVALERAMAKAEATLASEPKHAEAMVWHGAGLYLKAGKALRGNDSDTGMRLLAQGIAEMDRAVELAPDQVGVRVVRGSVLLASTRAMGANPMKQALLEKGVADYEHTLKVQTSYFDTLGVHPRGELLFGLAEGSDRLGRKAAAREYYERIGGELGGSAYARRAAEWLEKGTVSQTGCIGCHVPQSH